MREKLDLTHKLFGTLKVINFSHIRKGKTYWKCACTCKHLLCNKITIVQGTKLNTGYTIGCGVKSNSHGLSKTSEYNIWCSMKARCNTTKQYSKDFKNYRKRNIKYCIRWSLFENFIKDMGSRPNKIYSLERIDNDGNYSKRNCMWATKAQQNTNQRRSIGASYNNRSEKWQSAISKNGIRYSLGYFNNKKDAIIAYRNKKKELYGLA